MVTLKKISEEQAAACIQNQEFDFEILNSKGMVAVILTQSWCPQWGALKPALENLRATDIDVWVFIYDQSGIFEEFKQFKEMVLANDEIPYIRYYRNGEFIKDSNFVEINVFTKILRGK